MTDQVRSMRVRAFLRKLAEDASGAADRSPLDLVANALAPTGAPPLEVGQVWRVSDPGRRHADALVALTHVSDEVVRGVIAVEDPWLAGNEDVIVSPDQSPTGDALVLCTWSDTPLPRAALAGFVGELDPEAVAPLLMVLQRRLTGGFHLRARQTSSFEGAPVVAWEIWPPAAPAEKHSFVTGARILTEDDPRAEAQAFLAEATRWLGDAALDDLWSRCGAPEQLGFVDRLLAACQRLVDSGAAVLTPAPPPQFALGLGALVRLLPSARPEPTSARALRFSLTLGAVNAEVTVDVGREDFVIAVLATETGAPVRGLEVALKLGPPALRAVTKDTSDARGRALIRLALSDVGEDARGELVLRAGDARRVITL